MCPIQLLSILVCLDRSDILGNLTTSILWKDVAFLDLKLYIYKCSSNIQTDSGLNDNKHSLSSVCSWFLYGCSFCFWGCFHVFEFCNEDCYLYLCCHLHICSVRETWRYTRCVRKVMTLNEWLDNWQSCSHTSDTSRDIHSYLMIIASFNSIALTRLIW